MEWTKEQYNKQYEKWVPWLEEIYLRYFTKDNKASYTARGKPSNHFLSHHHATLWPFRPVPRASQSQPFPYP